MGRTVVVRSSYEKEIKKLDWMEQSILKDPRVNAELKATVVSRIELVRMSLIRVQNAIGAANVA